MYIEVLGSKNRISISSCMNKDEGRVDIWVV